jgi:cyclic beta-1,2-glucan synthetase
MNPILHSFRPRLFGADFEDLIRSELFTSERFDEHARSLASAQRITDDPTRGAKIFPRLRANGKILRATYQIISDAVSDDRAITPAAEWLLDSFYVVDEQIRDIERDLPKKFYDELPKLADGFLKGYPRVYGIAWAYVAHTDSRFDPELLVRFVRNYQTVQPLTIGELWAFSITLRVVMIENLRRIAERIVAAHDARAAADAIADQSLGLVPDTNVYAASTKTLAQFDRLLDRNAFLVQLVQRLRYHDPSSTPALAWLNEQLVKEGVTADRIASDIHQGVAATNVTVRNIITSFRSMANISWPDFFEQLSLVHENLCEAPDFQRMDFNTRDLYRHAVEDIARGSKKDEIFVARAALEKAGAAKVGPERDPGYYLIGAGRKDFSEGLGFRRPLRYFGIQWYLENPSISFLGSLGILSLGILMIPIGLSAPLESALRYLLPILGFFPAIELASALVNRFVTTTFGPRRLPRLEFLEGPTVESRTAVVIPTMISRSDGISAQLEKLEVHFLANPEGDTIFALLTDWSDSTTETREGDLALLEFTRKQITVLNLRHGPCSDGSPRFFLFHRARKWNGSEGKWMGWERKRGKLTEFNHLLRGRADTSFLIDGNAGLPPAGIRYVITLDSDTKLPKGAVAQLAGILSHPLNHARLDPRTLRVTEGYGILQPRITSALPGEDERSIYQALFSGECGVDPYASAVSDVYQDLFQEGSFTGKGIYDVDAFEASLAGRIPENALLSHDLFEGSFARSAFASDIEFFEDFPSHVAVSDARNHRWIRGDWQLLPWILGRRGNALSRISRWKMIDNLRRSVTPIATLSLIVVSILIPAVSAGPWIALALLGLGFPPLIPFLAETLPRSGRTIRDHAHELKRTLGLAVGHFGVSVTLLAHHAWLNADAIFRALWRILISRKLLLEWTTADQAKASANYHLSGFLVRMVPSIVIGAITGAAAVLLHSDTLFIALGFSTLWIIAPFFARFISLPESNDELPNLSSAETRLIRGHARRIWRFFTTFVTAEDHFLPPDNFQEDPDPVVAHRSSPTNFGLYLLSVVTAHDFGWCGLREMATRLDQTLRSMVDLPRFRGHFYNWYETRDRRILEPAYISSVDSGNLAGNLLALAQICDEVRIEPVFSSSAIIGIKDSVNLLRLEIERLGEDRRTSGVSIVNLRDAAQKFEERLNQPPKSPSERAEYWDALDLRAETLKDIARAFARERDDSETTEIVEWANLTAANVRSHAEDFRTLLPWAQFLSRAGLVSKEDPAADGHWKEINRILSLDLILADLAERCDEALPHFEALTAISAKSDSSVDLLYFDHVVEALRRSKSAALQIQSEFKKVAELSRTLFNEMEFGFLFNPKKRLFSIGYRVAEDQLDDSCYDLLASEARLTSYIAIIKGDVPVSHWFRLGRGLTPVTGGAVLLSWSGSMFEYLMPSIIMSPPRDSLLDRTCKLVVQRQIEYGNSRGIPWGISESAFNVRDLALTYQYSNFGVPGLGLKRGLGNDLVIAPYATALASMINPREALKNLARIENEGGRGPYGFYEAMDYTPSRIRENHSNAVVRAYMAHHQGMSLLAFANIILAGLPRKRFHREPLVKAAELLLQERTPRELGEIHLRAGEGEIIAARNVVEPVSRKFRSPHHVLPTSHLLSNGRYAVMITAAGSGYSRWKNLAVNRWRDDMTRDAHGSYFYLRDCDSNRVWSPTYHPAAVDPDHSETIFSEQEAKISRTDGTITTELRILVAIEDDAELRRLSITNHGTEARTIEVTSYSEVVLAPPDSERAHPAFSNLFVQTEFVPEVSSLFATRRPRSAKENRAYVAHVLASNTDVVSDVEYETDRGRFIGRGRSLRRPASVVDGRPLSRRTGAVLDPILSLRVRVLIAPGATTHLCFTTLVTSKREETLFLAEKYHGPFAFDRAATLVWTHAYARLRHLGIEPDEAQIFQKLANRILFSDPLMRPSSEIQKRNVLNVTGLWGRGISGDYPIILVRVEDAEEQTLVRQLFRAHEYWRMKRVSVDIVILNEKATSYVQDFQLSLEALSRGNESALPRDDDFYPGRVFVLRNDLLDDRERDLFQTRARVILNGRQGTLAEQVLRVRKADPLKMLPRKSTAEVPEERPSAETSDMAELAATLEFYNGIGGFANDGREYVIILNQGQRTPAPWINVISNAQFGFHVSETGSGYTWSQNSRENQLTAWSNDPIVDPSSEAIYLRDLESGNLWSPTAAPIRRETGTYVARHGRGYSVFEHDAFGIRSELTTTIGREDSVKIVRLQLENRSDRERKLSISGYVEWVLGFSRSLTAPYIITQIDRETGALFASNPMDAEFGRRVAFLDFGERPISVTGDRGEFIGRNGNLARPAALYRDTPLSGSVGAGLDPCGAMQTEITLGPGARFEMVILLGQTDNRERARDLIREYRRVDVDVLLAETDEKWTGLLDQVQVKTPDRAMDLLLNGWLLYQTIACRFWARAAFYQAGGAIGFRDQLQDTMAFVTAEPSLARGHILKVAARQFIEGDVQHWWHPPTGRGVRTHFSDDLLWLPYVLLHYLRVTEDQSVLDERVSFIEGAELRPDQEDAYFEPRTASADLSATLFEHAARAIDRSLAVGVHGLPIIGSGDWNDGMNRVGHEGKGESVWVGWFLLSIIPEMAKIAEIRGESARAGIWIEHASRLKAAIESAGWDGEWYRRAYFDDGTPLGSKENTECRIDSIAQTWAVLSGSGDPSRAREAMAAVEKNLVKSEEGLVLLFTPPFDQTAHDPGYIKGYVPGVRENGGQYTHAAVWCVCAFAELGEGDRAAQLFSMLNPIRRTASRTGVQTYKVEPYVMAADVYGVAPHVGRGGWTWYTGSSGWMYRSGVEFLLGIRKRGNRLEIDPCIPKEWPGFSAEYRHGKSLYQIQVENPGGVSRGVTTISIDGQKIDSNSVPLVDDGKTRAVRVILG